MFFCCISVWHVGKWLSSKSDMEYGVRVKLSSRFPVDCAYFLNPVFDWGMFCSTKNGPQLVMLAEILHCSSARPRRCCKCMILKQALWCISFAVGPNRCFHSAVWSTSSTAGRSCMDQLACLNVNVTCRGPSRFLCLVFFLISSWATGHPRVQCLPLELQTYKPDPKPSYNQLYL